MADRQKMTAEKKEQPRRIKKAPFVVILFFLIMGIIGIMNGEVERVLAQAIQVCLSCIGIG